MRQTFDESQAARKDFLWRNKKARRRQIVLLPLLAALLAPLAAFLWFAFTPPVAQSQVPLTPTAPAPAITVRAGGTVMLGGAMAEKLTGYGLDFPFRNISDFLAGADFSMAGLDSVLANTGSPLPGKLSVWRADISAMESLVLSNISLLGLASPHLMDYDTPALQQTIELLSGANIGHMGAGADAQAAMKPYALAQNGLRVAVLNFCENAAVYYSNQYPRMLAASETQAGVANLDETMVLEAIAEARRNHDVVILYLSWGENNAYLPRESQRELAHKLVDGGADIIIGSRPQSLQGVEIYNNGLIVYSLGQLLAANADTRQAQEAAVLELELTRLGWRAARLHPLLLSAEGQPSLASGQEAADICERLRSISTGFGANLNVEGETLKISK